MLFSESAAKGVDVTDVLLVCFPGNVKQTIEIGLW